MIIDLFLSFSIPWGIGYFLVACLFPLRTFSLAYESLKLMLGLPLGLGLVSLLYFILGGVGVFSWGGLFLVELSLLAVAGLGVLFQKKVLIAAKVNGSSDQLPDPWLTRGLVATCLLGLFLAAAAFWYLALRAPLGELDAWAIWNLKGRLLFRGQSHWVELLNALPGEHHPDYPLLLPGLVARGWTYLGRETPLVPMLLAFLFTFGVVGLTAAALGVLRSPSQSCLAVLVLLGTKEFFYLGTYQFSDMPLGLYFLTVMVLLSLKDALPGRPMGLAVLAGVAMGLAAWTKVEGRLFILATLAARWFLVTRTEGWKGSLRETGLLTLGCIPVLIPVGVFHLLCAHPKNILSVHDRLPVWPHLLEGGRYVQLVWGMVKGFFTWGDWQYPVFPVLAIYALLVGVRPARRACQAACPWIVFLLMGGGYALFYLLIPKNVEWYIYFSVNRLLLQLWPVLVLGYFLLVNTPEEALAAAAAGKERASCHDGSGPE